MANQLSDDAFLARVALEIADLDPASSDFDDLGQSLREAQLGGRRGIAPVPRYEGGTEIATLILGSSAAITSLKRKLRACWDRSRRRYIDLRIEDGSREIEIRLGASVASDDNTRAIMQSILAGHDDRKS